MDAAVAVLISAGRQLFVTRLFSTAFSFLWIYDYFVTLGDEVKYAWSGRKSWMFVLFLGNRYLPVLHLVWTAISMYSDSKIVKTRWFSVLYAHTVGGLSALAIASRVYAVTQRNKLLCAPLVLLIVAQACNGIVSSVLYTMLPIPAVPEEILRMFRLCVYNRYRPGALIYVSLALAFDIIAFLVLVLRAKQLGIRGYPGIPSILNIILRDATLYFVFIFLVQVLALLFLFIAPEVIQILPAAANTTFVPIMATRLMISLKKAASQPTGPWSVATMAGDYYDGRSPGDGTIQFAPNTIDASHGISETPSKLDEEVIELEPTPRSPRNRGSQELC